MNPYDPPHEPRKTTQREPSRPSLFREVLTYPVVALLFAILIASGCITLTALLFDLFVLTPPTD